MKNSYLKKIKLFLIVGFLMLSVAELVAQASTEHYIPPIYALNASGNIGQTNALFFANSEDRDATVKIFRGTERTTPLHTITVPSGDSFTQALTNMDNLSAAEMNINSANAGKPRSTKGIYIESDVPISVSWRGATSNTNQAGHLVSKGVNALGTTFRAGGVFDNKILPMSSGAYNNYSSFVSFYAAESGTDITITIDNTNPGYSFIKGLINANSSNTTVNGAHTYTWNNLNEGQSVVLYTGTTTPADIDHNGLMGSLIKSTKPITVNTGSWLGVVSGELALQDTGIDQIVPVELLGTEYIMSRAQGNNQIENATVIAHTNNTAVYVNGNITPYAVLRAGEVLLIDRKNPTDPDDATFAQPNTPYTANQNLYIRTSNPAYVYQNMAGDISNKTIGMFFVPPLICSAPRTAFVPKIADVSASVGGYSPGLNILTRSIATLKINGISLSTLLANGTVLNYGINNINGNNVQGLTENFVTYKLTGAGLIDVNGNVFVESTHDLYMAAYGFSGAAGHGGFYSGFEPTPTIKQTDPLAECLPLEIEAPDVFNGYQWFKDGAIIVGAKSRTFTVTEAGIYFVEANFTGCDPIQSGNTLEFDNVASPTANENVLEFCATEMVTIQTLIDQNIMGTGTVVGNPTTFTPEIRWYNVDVGDVANLPATPLGSTFDIVAAGSDRYYATVFDGTCESGTPAVLDIVIEAVAAPPTVNDAIQTFCADDNPTIADLIAIPSAGATDLVWFDVSFADLPTRSPLSPTQRLENGSTYYVANNSDGVCDFQGEATVEVKLEGSLSYTTSLQNQFVCDGVGTTLAVELRNESGNGTVTYLWETSIDNGATWGAIPASTGSDGGTITSADLVDSVNSTSQIDLDAQYILDQNTAAGANAPALYRVTATTGLCASPVRTQAAITIAGPITFNTQPVDDQTACGGDIVTLTADASDTIGSAITYLWQQRDTDVTIAPTTQAANENWNNVGTGKTLLVTAFTSLNQKEYRVLAFSEYCNPDIDRIVTNETSPNVITSETASDVVNIQVDGPIQIEQPVTNQTVCNGGSATFEVLASTGSIGSTADFLWEVDTDGDNTFEDLTAYIAGDADLSFDAGATATSQNLELTGITAAHNGFRFRVSVTTADCTAPVTSTGTLIVEGPITALAITSSPTDNIICEGDLFSLTASATTPEGAITYIWEESPDNSPGSYSTIGSGPNLLLSNVSATKDGFYYRAVASTGKCIDNATSTPVQLRVTGPLFVTQELVSQTVCAGDDATFTVAVDPGTFTSTPTTDLTYVWEKRTSGGSFVPVTTGETTDSSVSNAILNLAAAAIIANGNSTQYRVSVSNSKCTSAVSSTALLTIEGPVSFDVDPQSQTKCAGDVVTFSANAISANAGTISYIWEESTNGGADWSVVGTGFTLVLSNLQASQHNNQYRAVATTSKCSRVESMVATLSVEGPISIDTPVADKTVCYDGTTLATTNFEVTATAPVGAVTYLWKKSTDAGTTFNNVPLAETVDNTNTNATLQLKDLDDSFNGDLYQVEISTGACEVVKSTATLFIEGPLSYTDQPDNVSTCEGSAAIFSVVVTNGGSGTVQTLWQVDLANDAPDAGWIPVSTGTTLTVSSISIEDNGNKYRAVSTTDTCTNGAGGIISSEATLTVGGGVVINQLIQNETVCADEDTPQFVVDASAGAGSETYTWFLEDSVGSGTFSTALTLADTDGGNNGGLGVLENTLNLSAIAAANVADFNNRKVRVEVSAGACTTGTVESTATLFVEGPITVAPANEPTPQTICAGGTAVFSVEAEPLVGSGNLTYQWEVELASTPAVEWIPVGTGASFVVSNATASQNGNKYRVVISTGANGVCTSKIFPTNGATLTVEGPISITSPLEDKLVCDDGSGTVTTTFEVGATWGAGTPTYVWERFNTTTNMWDLVTGAETTAGNATGLGNNTLELANITAANDNTQYRVSITTGACANPVQSSATLNVEGPLAIVTPVTNQVVCAGAAAVFETEVSTGAGNVTYIWEEEQTAGSNTFIPVGSGTTYVKSNVNVLDNGKKVRVTANAGTACMANVQEVTLTVDGPITITKALEDIAVCGDGSTSHTFEVTATTGVSTTIYEWQRDINDGNGFMTIPGEITNTLTVNVITDAENGYQYKVIVSTEILPGTAGPCLAQESIATLTVQGPITIATPPQAQTVCAGDVVSFSVDASVPANGGNLTYVWQQSNDGFVADINPIGTGTNLNLGLARQDMNGLEYRVIVSTDLCEVESVAAELTVDGPIQINTPLQDVLLCDDGSGTLTHTFMAAATAGDSDVVYKWQRDINDGNGFTDIAGATNALTVPVLAANNNYRYKVIVSSEINGVAGVCPSEESIATLNVEGPIVIATQPDPAVECAGSTAVFTVAANALVGAGTLAYQWEEQLSGSTDWIPVGNGPTLAKSNLTNSQNGNKYRVIVSAGTACTPEVSDEVTLTVEGPITIVENVEDTLVCHGDTFEFSVTANAGVAGALTYQWESSTDGVMWDDVVGETTDTYTATADAVNDNTLYRVRLETGECAEVISATGKLDIEGPIAITTQPTPATECAGGTAIFEATATTTAGTLAYQWEEQLSGSTDWIPVGNGPTLAKSNLTNAQNGNKYRVIVSAGTACTPEVSDEVTLTVEGPITIVENVEDTLVCHGDAFEFSVTANAGVAGTLTYQWESSTDGVTWNDVAGATTDTYTATADAANDNTQYRVRLETGECAEVISATGKLDIEGPIAITTQPVPATECAGGTAIFEATATTTAGTLAYQWEEQLSGSTDWIPVGNGPTLAKSNLTNSQNGNKYRVIVSAGTACTPEVSDEVTLTVEGPITIVENVEDTLVCHGDAFEFSVTANAGVAGTLTYQWESSADGVTWNDVVGETTDTYTATADAVNDNILYRVRLETGECAEVISATGKLDIEGPIAITTQPVPATECAGGTAIFEAAATTTAGTLAYQWEEQLSGSTDWIPVGNGPTLAKSNLTNSQNGNKYRVIVSAGTACTPEVSDEVTLTVEGPITIVENVEDTLVCHGDAFEFSVTANAGVAGTLTYQWESSTDGVMWDDVVGATTDTYTATADAANDNTQYRVRLETGECAEVISATGKLDIEGPIVIATQPQDATECAGGTAIFEAAATTTAGTLSYQWEEQLSGSTDWIPVGNGPTLAKSNLTNSQNGNKYRVIVSAGTACTPEVSDEVTLTVEGPITIVENVEDTLVCHGDAFEFSVTANAGVAGTLTYQWESSTDGVTWNDVVGETTDTYTATADAANDNTQYRVRLETGECAEVISATGKLDIEGPIAITTQPTPATECAGGTAIFEATATTTAGTLAYQWEEQLSGSTDWIPVGNGPTLAKSNLTNSQNGNKYRVIVSAGTACTPEVSDEVTLTVEGPITIVENVEDTLVCHGDAFEFSVTANAGVAGTLTYQWESSTDGVTWNDVVGETTDTYTATADAANDNTQYRVRLETGECAEVISATGKLDIEGPIAITTQPTPATECAGGTAIFEATATTTAGTLAYQWEEQLSGSTDWIPVGNGPTLAKSNLTNSQNGNKYRVIVSAGTACTPEVSDEVTLTVEGPITIVENVEDTLVCHGDAFEFSVTANAGVAGTLTYQWESSADGVTWNDVVGETTDTYTATADAVNDNILYRVRLETGECAEVISATGKLDIEGPIAITTQPTPATECAGGTAIFEAAATTTAGTLTYQWEEQLSGSTDWIPVGNGPTLAKSSLSNVQNGNKYRVIVSAGTACAPEVSDEVTLTVEGPISIVQELADMHVCDGDVITFEVKGTNGVAGNITYNWESSTDEGTTWTPITENTNTYETTVTSADNNTLYRVNLTTGACVSPLESTARLKVDGPITITQQPEAVIICEGQTAIFNVGADGNGAALTYEWEESTDGGTTWEFVNNSATYVKPGLVLADHNNLYRVKIFSEGCTTPKISNAVILEVLGIPFIEIQLEDELGDIGETFVFEPVISNLSEFIDDAYEFQWQVNKDDSNGWTDLGDNETYMGTTTTVLTVNNAPFTFNGNQYRLVIRTPICGIVLISEAGKLILDFDIIPNTFTPNGDGIHDTFVFPLLFDYPNFEMAIHDRRGNLMHVVKGDGGDNKNVKWWDGSLRNRGGDILPSATYFYVIHYNKNNRAPTTGWVFLKK